MYCDCLGIEHSVTVSDLSQYPDDFTVPLDQCYVKTLTNGNLSQYLIVSISSYHCNTIYSFTADAFDHDLMFNCLKDIQEAKPTKVPVYDFKTNSRK